MKESGPHPRPRRRPVSRVALALLIGSGVWGYTNVLGIYGWPEGWLSLLYLVPVQVGALIYVWVKRQPANPKSTSDPER